MGSINFKSVTRKRCSHQRNIQDGLGKVGDSLTTSINKYTRKQIKQVMLNCWSFSPAHSIQTRVSLIATFATRDPRRDVAASGGFRNVYNDSTPLSSCDILRCKIYYRNLYISVNQVLCYLIFARNQHRERGGQYQIFQQTFLLEGTPPSMRISTTRSSSISQYPVKFLSNTLKYL